MDGFDWSFGSGSSWNFTSGGGGGAVGSGSGAGSTGSTGSTGGGGVAPGTDKPWYGVVLDDALGAWRTFLAYDLQNEQVARGQYPGLTGPGGNGGVGTGGSGAGLNLGGLLPIVIMVVIAVVGFSLLKSVLK